VWAVIDNAASISGGKRNVTLQYSSYDFRPIVSAKMGKKIFA
jgi:hypothetical protein